MPFWGASRREENASRFENTGSARARREVVKGRAREAAQQRQEKRARADRAARERRNGSKWWS